MTEHSKQQSSIGEKPVVYDFIVNGNKGSFYLGSIFSGTINDARDEFSSRIQKLSTLENSELTEYGYDGLEKGYIAEANGKLVDSSKLILENENFSVFWNNELKNDDKEALKYWPVVESSNKEVISLRRHYKLTL
ncbi:MAG: hypothetical protein QM500_12445 [Methylococcales bacterium]